MQHGKKPTVAQRKHIKANKLNAENWLVCRDTKDEMIIEHRLSGKLRKLPGRGT